MIFSFTIHKANIVSKVVIYSLIKTPKRALMTRICYQMNINIYDK